MPASITNKEPLDVEVSTQESIVISDHSNSHVNSFKKAVHRYRKWLIAFVWMLLTAYFIAGLSLHFKKKASDILSFTFIYIFITGHIASYYISARRLVSSASNILAFIKIVTIERLSPRLKHILSFAILLSLALCISLGLPVQPGESRLLRMQSLLGIITLTGLLTATSRDYKHINWRTVIAGYYLQFILGCIVMKTKWGSEFFSWIANLVSGFLGFASFGASLLFGPKAMESGSIALTIFPVIIFFASFVQVMYYLGAVQWVLRHVGWFFYKVLGTSSVESIVASASPFVGQSENMLLVKDYLKEMTNSELHACMTAGFATISGSVFQAYVVLGVDAKNLITACVMSIPCSLALSKIRYPETRLRASQQQGIEIARHEREANILHALGNGAATGVHLSLLILATIIAMVSSIYAINFFFTWLGQFVGIHTLSLELVLGYLFYPLTWLLGVPHKDVLKVSQLLGIKLVANEFVAYSQLTGASGNGTPIQAEISPRALMISQFALAGFANTGSVAQVIAAVGSLAPSRKADVSRLAVSACLTGALATAMSAAIVSMIV